MENTYAYGYRCRKVKFIAVHFDLKTLLVCLFFADLFTVLLVLAYHSRYPRDGTSRLFIVAKLLQLVILILLLLEDSTPFKFLRLILALGCLAGATAEMLALLKLLGASTDRVMRRYYTLAGCSGAGLLVIEMLFPLRVQPIVIVWTSLSIVGLMAYPVYILCVKLKETPLQKIMGLLYSLVMLSLLGRAVEPFLGTEAADTAASGLLQAFFYIAVYLLLFLWTAGFMLLSRERIYAELERVSTYDELTRILNRRAFVQRAGPLLAAAANEASPFSFLLLDVDHFKSINDTYGHDTGDKVLRDFAGKIEGQLANGDLFGRFGGEEFAVFLHRADEAASDEIAERLRLSVLDTVVEGLPMPYTISIGVITVTSAEMVPLNTLYKLSDNALYEAKQQGRNCVSRSRLTRTLPLP